MPTRKQRRRRQKELRHEYEVVYVDEEGHEVEVEPKEAKPRSERRNGKRDSGPAKKSRFTRSAKQVPPPSWRRVVKRALLFGPLIFLAFSVINSSQPILGRLAVTVVYTAFFVPFMYLMDRAMYRAYLRRSGQQLPSRGAAKKR
jgi:Flp pilus assembly protein TadB